MKKLISKKSLAYQLKKKRIDTGLEQCEVALLLKISPSHISRLESAERPGGRKLQDKILKLISTKNEVLRFATTRGKG